MTSLRLGLPLALTRLMDLEIMRFWSRAKSMNLGDSRFVRTKLDPCGNCSNIEFSVLRRKVFCNDIKNTYTSSSSEPLRSQLAKCSSCGTVQVNPRVGQAELLLQYSSAIDEIHSLESELRVKSFIRAMNKVVKFDSDIGPNSSRLLVDVGCAGGEFPEAARRLGYSIRGFEPAKHLATLAKRKYGLEIYDCEFNPNLLGGPVDIVTFWDVLEHIEQPLVALENSWRALHPKGYLILNLPMIDTFSEKLLRKKWPFYLEVHLYYWTIETLSDLLKRAGFRVLKHFGYSQTLSLRYLLQRYDVDRLAPIVPNLPIRYRLGQRTIVCQKL
jgi:SAM-dependent methyltransferase